MRSLLITSLFVVLSACAATAPARFAVDPVVAPETRRSSARTVVVTKAELPAYAKETSIYVQNAAGALVEVPKSDWADDTERALVRSLVRNIANITGAQVAADPWPLGGVPEAEIRVAVDQMFVDASQTMRLSGQYSIRRDVRTGLNRIAQFDIDVPAASQAPRDVVDAHGQAWRELSQLIAGAL